MTTTTRTRLHLIPATTLADELAYVAGARHWWSRAWRSARAAWRCTWIARRARRDELAVERVVDLLNRAGQYDLARAVAVATDPQRGGVS